MRMVLFRSARSAALALALPLLLLPALARAQVQWNLATGYPDSSFHVRNLRAFAADVAARTNGQVQITVHPGGSLVKAPDVYRSVMEGKIAAGEVFGPSLGRIHPVFALDAIPFLATNYGAARRLWNVARPLAEKKALEQGTVLLYSVPWPPQGLFSQKEIRSSADLRGLKMRENSPSMRRLAELLGAEPVSVETPDLVTAINTDRLQVVFTSAAQGVDTKMWEKLPWFYGINAWLPRNVVAVSKKSLDQLSPTQRDAVIRAAAAAEEKGWVLSAQNAEETLKTLKEKGARVGNVDGGTRAKLDRAGSDLGSDAMKRADPELLNVLSTYLNVTSAAR